MGYLLYTVGTDALWEQFATFDLRWGLVVLGLVLVGTVVSAYKWWITLRAMDLSPPFPTLLRLQWIGQYYNIFLPGRTGGDIARAWSISRISTRTGVAAVSVLIDRGFSLAGLAFLAFVALPATQVLNETPILGTIVQLVGVTIGTFGLCVWAFRKWADGRRLSDTLQGVARIAARTGALVHLSLLSIAYNVIVILANYATLRGLGLTPALAPLFCLIPLTAIVAAVPLSINGFGIREGAYVTALATMGIGAEHAISTSIIVTSIVIGVGLLGGVIQLTTRGAAPILDGGEAAQRC